MRSLRPFQCLLLYLAMGCAAGFAQSGVLDDSLAQRLGAGYAAMINFAGNPDITTAHYYINQPAGDDPTLRILRFGGQHEFKRSNHGWVPFVQLAVPYQTMDATITSGTNGTAKTSWSALGGLCMAGIKVPLTERLHLCPTLGGGYVRLENDVDYSGDVAALEPLLKGTVFDWASDAWLAGTSVALDYERAVGSRTLTLHAGAAHNWIETFDTPRGQVEFSSYATTLSFKGELVSPIHRTLMDNPLALVTMAGATTFVGPHRDELGFDYFMDAGFALETDLTKHDWRIKKLRLGAKGIYGEDVVGWSAIFSWKF